MKGEGEGRYTDPRIQSTNIVLTVNGWQSCNAISQLCWRALSRNIVLNKIYFVKTKSECVI